jgi:hypothetical protein
MKEYAKQHRWKVGSKLQYGNTLPYSTITAIENNEVRISTPDDFPGRFTNASDIGDWKLVEDDWLFEEIADLADLAPSGGDILDTCIRITKLLLEKNIAYGNSALNPIRIFSKASTAEQILVRIDDKLNRLKNGSDYPGEDTVDDLIGYLILLKVQMDNDSQ